jgi:hypothetical protein
VAQPSIMVCWRSQGGRSYFRAVFHLAHLARFAALIRVSPAAEMWSALNSDIISAREPGAGNLGRVGNNRLRCCPYSEWLFATQTEKTLTIVR